MSEKFFEFVKDQFAYGGVKYASSNQKEVTDILTDDYGLNGLLWCINKYTHRYKNTGREKDLLKIATYMYILWLKFGFHISEHGTVNDNHTTVAVKSQYFDQFLNLARNYSVPVWANTHRILDEINSELLALRVRANVSQFRLLNVFRYAEAIWEADGFDVAETHDTDTWNRDDKRSQ